MSDHRSILHFFAQTVSGDLYKSPCFTLCNIPHFSSINSIHFPELLLVRRILRSIHNTWVSVHVCMFQHPECILSVKIQQFLFYMGCETCSLAYSYCSRNTVSVIKWKRMRSVRHIAHIVEIWNAYKHLDGNAFGGFWCRWVDVLKWILEIQVWGYELGLTDSG
jgi:hypothetical protein